MKISQNFLAQEFVPKSTYDVWGDRSIYFISQKAVKYAEFLKSFLTSYYKNKLGNDKVKTVLIVINNWHTGGPYHFRGYRSPDCLQGAKESQHRFCNAFDCDIIIVMNDGTKMEADYKEIHEIIKANEAEFMANGVTTIEDVSIASTWLHTDFRWTGLKNILVVKP